MSLTHYPYLRHPDSATVCVFLQILRIQLRPPHNVFFPLHLILREETPTVTPDKHIVIVASAGGLASRIQNNEGRCARRQERRFGVGGTHKGAFRCRPDTLYCSGHICGKSAGESTGSRWLGSARLTDVPRRGGARWPIGPTECIPDGNGAAAVSVGLTFIGPAIAGRIEGDLVGAITHRSCRVQ